MTLQALLIPFLATTSADATPCVGAYVEARTASVFAGACHYNGEFVTVGREALCAWRIESGTFGGEDLSGVAVAAIVTAERNLDRPDAERRSTILVDARLAPERATAAVRWLAATRADLIGTVMDVRSVALDVHVAGESYGVVASEFAELRGSLMPNRACCSMPQNVWYAPFESLDRPLVGLNETFRVDSSSLARQWSRPDENAAFVGRFGPVAEQAAPAEVPADA